jgi:hypothetical protein
VRSVSSDLAPEKLWDDLLQAKRHHWPVTVYTHTASDLTPMPPWLRHTHAFTILGPVVRAGNRMVRIRDPHADIEKQADDPQTGAIFEGRGVFLLPVEQTQGLFHQVDVHQLHLAPSTRNGPKALWPEPAPRP